MKFGKKLRTELSPDQLRGSVNYKGLKQIAKELRRIVTTAGWGGTGGAGSIHHQHQHQHEFEQGVEEFFGRLEVEKTKVAEFYRSREAWCFLALESTRGSLFGLTRTASKDRLCLATQGVPCQDQGAAGELEGKFLEANAAATVLLSESRDLVQFADMNMHAFRKLLKKFDKWTGGVSGREYFTSLVQTQPWINGDRAHGVLRMACAMSDHLRSLRPALALGPAAGDPSWADRIVYSVGTFDRPRSSAEPNTATMTMPVTPPGSAATIPTTSGGFGHDGTGCTDAWPPTPPLGATEDALEGPSPLRFLREFGAVVVVGVYTDEAHAISHRGSGGGGDGDAAGGGLHPSECLEARVARVRQHADRVVVVDSADPGRVREILFGAATGAVGIGAPTNNCCFVVSDWSVTSLGGTEAGRRERRDVQALMEASMPVFRLPSPTWECAVTSGCGEEEEEDGGGGRGATVAAQEGVMF